MSMGWYIQHGTLSGHLLEVICWIVSMVSYISKGWFQEGVEEKIQQIHPKLSDWSLYFLK